MAVPAARPQPAYGGPMSLRELFWPLLGNWAGNEEQAESPWGPAAAARAMQVFKLDVADQAVLQDYRQVRSDGAEFTGHGVFLREPEDGGVLWWLFDSTGIPPEAASGAWVGRTLTCTRQSPRGRATHRFEVIADDLLHYAVEVTLPGAEPAPFLTGRYRRISGH